MNHKNRWWVIAFISIAVLVAVGYAKYYNSPATSPAPASPTELSGPAEGRASSAKGVIQLDTPEAKSDITSPLQVTGFVYGNNGTLTIQLAQKESGVVVAEKTATIKGQADRLTFAESLQFALPAVPQPGVLTVTYEDNSGKGLTDNVSIQVAFPSDLSSGRN